MVRGLTFMIMLVWILVILAVIVDCARAFRGGMREGYKKAEKKEAEKKRLENLWKQN